MTQKQQIYVPYDFKVGAQTTHHAVEPQEIPNLGQIVSLIAGIDKTKEGVRVLQFFASTEVVSGGLPEIDGVQIEENDRVLVVGQADKKQNGLYLAKDTGTAWVRTEDADESIELLPYTHVNILEGNSRAGQRWYLDADDAIDPGVDEQVWRIENVGATLANDIAFDHSGTTYLTNKSNVQAALKQVDSQLQTNNSLSTVLINRITGLVGTPGNTLPNFTGTLISDGSNVIEAVQILENAVEASMNKYEQSKYTTPIDVLVQPNAWTTIQHDLAEAFVSSVGIFDVASGFENITHSFKWRPKDGDANAIEIYHSLATALNVRVTVRK